MAVLLVLALVVLPAPACGTHPVGGPISAPFAPGAGFGGHWGLDFRADPGTPVVAVLAGTVTFAGLVVDNRAVTVRHGGRVRTSYSFLTSIEVDVGDVVAEGQRIGTSGLAHGVGALHFSLRVRDRYLDPVRVLSCDRYPAGALHLVSDSGRYPTYAVRRAARNSGRNLRPLAHSAPHGRRSRAATARSRRHHLYHRR